MPVNTGGGVDMGRRTKTAHVRTRGERVVCYGDLTIPEWPGLHEGYRDGLPMFARQ
jgi:hypothetical protein